MTTSHRSHLAHPAHPAHLAHLAHPAHLAQFARPARPVHAARPARRVALALAAVTTLGLGCGGSEDGNKPVGNVVLKDANNYSAVSALTIPSVQTASGADLQVCWNGIAKDLLCHTADPIGNVAFLKIPNVTRADIEHKLAIGVDISSQVPVYRELHTTPGSTCTMLSALSYGSGTTLVPATDYVEKTGTQYLMLFTRGTALGTGAQSMIFIEPTSTSTNMTVAAPDACDSNVLDFTATLSAQPLVIPIAGPWKLDWSSITHDGFGNDVKFQNIDKVEVGFYPGMTADYLQSHFLDIEIIPGSTLYEVTVPRGQKYIDLAGAHTKSGTAFPGFADSASGAWAVAVLCTACSVPAPIAFAVLAPQ